MCFHKYLTFYEIPGLPIIGPIPSTTTHQELKKFVQGICEDIVNLTNTLDFSGVPGRQQEQIPYFDPKKYEQLLATAVLNKVSDLSQICSFYVVVALIHVLRIDFLTWFIWQSFEKSKEKSKNVNNDLLGLPSLSIDSTFA